MRILVPTLSVLAIAGVGCSKPASPSVQNDSAPQTPAAAVARPGAPAGAQAAQPQLAYSYTAEVSAPQDEVPQLLARHEAACARAGAAVCQVTGASRTDTADGAHAQLVLRAQPAWLQAFRTGLPADVRPLGGKVVATATTSEDLTRSIIDTDAALRAKTTLADRLQQMLATRQGNLAETLETEKALAQTQGEIDAARSELAVMQARVATSDFTLSYTSRRAFAGPWRPVAEALHGAVGVFAQALAALILLAASLLPFALIAAAAALVWRWAMRRRLAKAASAPP